jgi:hypothetical protein
MSVFDLKQRHIGLKTDNENSFEEKGKNESELFEIELYSELNRWKYSSQLPLDHIGLFKNFEKSEQLLFSFESTKFEDVVYSFQNEIANYSVDNQSIEEWLNASQILESNGNPFIRVNSETVWCKDGSVDVYLLCFSRLQYNSWVFDWWPGCGSQYDMYTAYHMRYVLRIKRDD